MEVVQLAIDQIVVGKRHVRSVIQEEGLENLASSIEELGVLQPILVYFSEDSYFLVAGERRLAAAKRQGLPTIPAQVLSSDRNVRQIQLVENVQREDLNPVDKAIAVQAFIDEGKLNKTAAAKKIGVPRTTLNDWLTVLDVPARYQQAVINNHYGGSSTLTPSHIALAKRFSQKLNSPAMVEVVLDTVMYYGLTRAETKKALELVCIHSDLSLETAVQRVRSCARPKGPKEEELDWDVERLVSFLSRSGDYLVKCKPSYLDGITDTQRMELLRQSRVLSKLLAEVTKAIGKKTKIS